MKQVLLVGQHADTLGQHLGTSLALDGFEVTTLALAPQAPLHAALTALPPSDEPLAVMVLSAESLLAQPSLVAAGNAEATLASPETLLQQQLLNLKTLPSLADTLFVLLADTPLSAQQLDGLAYSGFECILPLSSLSDGLQCAALRTSLGLFLQQQQALWASHQMNEQLSEMNGELYDRNVLIENELYGARQMQQGLLPLALPDDDYPLPQPEATETPEAGEARGFRFSQLHYRDTQLKVTGLYLPCDALGGDLYDVVKFKDDSLGVTMADVSGHGVPAGFITALFKSSFYRMTHAYQKPNDILYHLNNEMAELIKTGDYITGLYCRFIENGNLIQFAGAGHPYPLLYRKRTGQIELLEENGPPLVWMPGMAYGMIETPFEPGDKLLLYTDGITEMQDPDDNLYGEDRLMDLFKQLAEAHNSGKPTLPLLDALLQQLSDYTQGRPLGDDLSMVLVEHV
jgi:serine phosphatase RsbU (regulator of sigma subunit)